MSDIKSSVLDWAKARAIYVCAAIIIFIFLILTAHQAAKPLNLDSMDFPAVAKATSETGKPIYYRGEGLENASGLYHPPLYIYSLASWYSFFGYSNISTRTFGAFFVLIQCLLTLIIGFKLLDAPIKNWLISFLSGFLLSAYTISVSSIPDIDSSIYGPIMLLYAISLFDFKSTERSEVTKKILILSSLLSLVFWTKLTTVWLLLPFTFFALNILGHNKKNSLLLSLLIFMLGFLLFYLSYYFYGWFTSQDINYSFNFLIYSLKNRGTSEMGRLYSSINNFKFNLPFVLNWTSIGIWLGAAIFIFSSISKWPRLKAKQKLFLLLILTSLICVLYYSLQVTPFGGAPQKYIFVFWSVLCIGTAVGILELLSEADKLLNPANTIGYFIALFFGLFYLKDSHILASSSYGLWLHILSPVAIGLTLACLLIITNRLRSFFSLIRFATTIAIISSFGLETGVAIYQTKANYSTSYNYGQTGFEDTVAFIKTMSTEHDIISSMKDIGFASSRKYYENYAVMFNKSAQEKLISLIKDKKIKFIVFTKNRGEDNINAIPAFKQKLEMIATIEREFGDYVIYKPI